MARRQLEVRLTHFCATLEECPRRPIPEIALSGRSNVGKSSLVNLLVRRQKLAYTSKQPGKTRVFTYYEVDDRWNLVDMPGYGYAKVGSAERNRWLAQARRYFAQREQLAAVIQLIDLKVGPTPDDRARLRDLVATGRPLCLAMTKSDKLARSRREQAVREHLGGLDLALPSDTAVVVTSAAERFGHDELLAWVEDVLATTGNDAPSVD
jgi:GTP-binding protein